MEKYEYKIRNGKELKIGELDKELQKYGQKGWELASIYNDIYIFKRVI